MKNGELGALGATAAEEMFNTRLPWHTKVLIVAALVGIFVVSFALGRYPIAPVDLVVGLFNHTMNDIYNLPAWIQAQFAGTAFAPTEYFAVDPRADRVIYNIRLPRIILVMLVGAALAVAGASYQGMFKNPLVSPDLLGASAGASLGASVAMLLNAPGWLISLGAFAGGIIAVSMAVWFGSMVKHDPVLSLVLGGILVSTLFQAGMSMVKFMADADDKLPTITFWLMGSFATVNDRDVWLAIVPLLLGFAILLTQRWKLNVLSFGDEEARSMGVNTSRTRLLVIAASTLLASISVAVAGIIGWIGLVIPHLARAVVGPNYKVLLPASMLIGAGYLLIVDDLARLLTTVEIPIGILTAILGVPFFIVIFKRNMRGWG
jgi:iron complex transport system permease protein